VKIATVAIRLRLRTAAHVGRLDRLDVDRVVLAHEGERRLVVKVAALSAHVLLLLCALRRGFRASLAALLAASDMLLCLLQLALGLPRVPGGLDAVADRRDAKDRQPDIDAGRFAGERQRRYRHVGTGARHLPAIRFFGERDSRAGADQRTTPPHGNAPELGEDQIAVIPLGAVAVLLVR
jgi:hypothetical protein